MPLGERQGVGEKLKGGREKYDGGGEARTRQREVERCWWKVESWQ